VKHLKSDPMCNGSCAERYPQAPTRLMKRVESSVRGRHERTVNTQYIAVSSCDKMDEEDQNTIHTELDHQVCCSRESYVGCRG
jgi:hypothetical protein